MNCFNAKPKNPDGTAFLFVLKIWRFSNLWFSLFSSPVLFIMYWYRRINYLILTYFRGLRDVVKHAKRKTIFSQNFKPLSPDFFDITKIKYARKLVRWSHDSQSCERKGFKKLHLPTINRTHLLRKLHPSKTTRRQLCQRQRRTSCQKIALNKSCCSAVHQKCKMSTSLVASTGSRGLR